MAQRQPADADVRARALEPYCSFIVQAPAGSGKTELLIQRYLRLLSIVDAPEEILAITFTVKAAGEMRTRIENALNAARRNECPEEPHLVKGFEFATAVIERDRELGWGLADQPARLRISTIDSVNAGLSRRAPISAGVTAQNTLLEDTGPIYAEAARDTLLLGQDDSDEGDAVRTLLRHCDNDAGRVEGLLTMMLGRRDQWLPYTGSGRIEPDALRARLERGLRQLVEHSLAEAAATLPVNETGEIVDCLQYAGEQLALAGKEHDALAWEHQDALPAPTSGNLRAWRGMAGVLLTQKGHWRSSPNVGQGFPAGNGQAGEMKQRVKALLARLADAEEFRAALGVVGDLPEPSYSDTQWSIVWSLWRVLPITVALLKDQFARRGETDYAEIAREALDSLGVDGASELRLALDYQLKHILLDEFQDTSRAQYDLLERLTEGWDNEPDRSVFLVGDPMQSIYRFREAEVGLFLATRDAGLGGLQLEFLRLTTNFRSNGSVVDWFNDAFDEVLPDRSDPAAGAVSFTSSVAFEDADAACGVTWHVVPHGVPEFEAERTVQLIRERLAADDDETIGVLVRSRAHAVTIAECLRAANIDYVGTGLEKLQEQPLVQDLLALTRALVHPGDRLAWLACLRAPWCGLTLGDLHALAYADHDATVHSLLDDERATGRLSDDGRQRLVRFRGVILHAQARRGALPLRDLVEQTWLQLGGPATAIEDEDIEQADLFFRFLGSLGDSADCADGAELLDRLGEVHIDRHGANTRVQIMTMHKAKGLEFDNVILPGLGLTTRSGDKPLLLFDELVGTNGERNLVVAPLKSSEQSGDALYDLLWRFETERDRYEQQRLLYVATTRGRRRLHLFAGLALNDDDENSVREPAGNTLLARLWPVAQRQIDVHEVDLPVAGNRSQGRRPPIWADVPLRRLPPDWVLPDSPPASPELVLEADRDAQAEVEFEWASQWAKHVGTVVHRWLQHISDEGVDDWHAQRLAGVSSRLRRALRHLGVATGDLDAATERTIEALRRSLDDDRGRWILASIHAEAANEVPITTAQDQRFANHIIDRTFVDDDGTRWVIDYKTSTHEGGDERAFLDSEAERYRPQLRRYRDAFAMLEDRPIRTALYFPLLQAFHEVDCDA